MRFKATIFLSFVLILLGAYLLYVEIPGEAKKREAEIEAKRLFSFSLSEITRLTLRRPEEDIELEYFPDHPQNRWRMALPVSTVADEGTASNLASQLVRLETTRLVEAKPTELKDFGLDPPAYTVIVTLNHTDTEILEIGAENLTGTDVYVRKGEGTSLYLVPAGIKAALEKPTVEWRRREVFSYRTSDVKEIRIASPRGRTEIVREGEGWSIKKPFSSSGDPSEIANFLGSLANLRGEDFIDHQKEEKIKELGPPVLEVELKVDQIRRDITFYRTDGPEAVYAVTSQHDPIYEISPQSFNLIDQPPSAFRDKTAVSLTDPRLVEEIEISRPGKRLLLVKKEGAWRSEGPSGKRLDEEKISRFLSNLYRLKVEGFVGEKEAGAALSTPQATLRLKGKGGELIDELIFGRIDGERIYGRSRSQGVPFFLAKEELDGIPVEEDLIPSAGSASEQAPSS